MKEQDPGRVLLGNFEQLDVEDEQISAEELGMVLTPVWGGAVSEA